jgi:hypothetical protein
MLGRSIPRSTICSVYAWGWTEFVVTMFPAYWVPHQRRPVQLPGMPAAAEVGGADE